ncbi:hypothetical protein [Micromonospora sp. NPDC004704]
MTAEGQRIPELQDHGPLRPFWFCHIDALPWPCPDARLNLIHGFEGRRVALYLYLAGQFVHALDDLYSIDSSLTAPPEPAAIHARIIGWVAAHETRRRRRSI